MQQGLGLHSIKSLYEETQALNHASMRLKGDEVVIYIHENAISQESQLVRRRKNNIVQAQARHTKALDMHCQDGEIPPLSHHKGHNWTHTAIKWKI